MNEYRDVYDMSVKLYEIYNRYPFLFKRQDNISDYIDNISFIYGHNIIFKIL